MITEYHRPSSLDEAIALLARPNTVPLGGGTLLSKPSPDPFAVVDLQKLGLDSISTRGNDLVLGATVPIQAIYEYPNCASALKRAVKLEAPINIRNSATLAGTIVASNGRSPLTTMLLALDTHLVINHGITRSSEIGLGEFLITHPKGLITSFSVPLNAKTAFEYVSRTPSDKPIVSAALAQWISGRTRLTLGGYGVSPILAMDGTEAIGIEHAAINAYQEANDEWASAEYRMDIAATLTKRCLAGLA